MKLQTQLILMAKREYCIRVLMNKKSGFIFKSSSKALKAVYFSKMSALCVQHVLCVKLQGEGIGSELYMKIIFSYLYSVSFAETLMLN